MFLIATCESIMDVRLQRKKEGLLDQARVIEAFIRDVDINRLTSRTVDLKQAALLNLQQRHQKVFEDLHATCPDDRLEILNTENREFENLITNADQDLELARRRIPRANLPNVPPPQAPAQPAAKTVQLPKTKLKTFSGGLIEWTEFFDLFKVEVDHRPELEAVQKFSYLKNSLDGEPASLVKSLAVTEQNYHVAITLLKDRYEDKSAIRDAYFRKLFGISKMVDQTAAGLRKMVMAVTEVVQGMRNLGEPTQHWDSWLIFVIRSKLDFETHKAWQNHLVVVRNNEPTVDSILKFLNQYARNLETCGNFKSKTSGRQGQDRDWKVSLIGKEGWACFFCGQSSHMISACPTFLGLSAVERRSKLDELGLCYNCFGRSHVASSCSRAPMCKHCSQKHNTLLHGAVVNSHVGMLPEDSEVEVVVQENSVSETQEESQAQDITSLTSVVSHATLLATMLVKVELESGVSTLRALLDPGSQASFITTEAVQRMGLQPVKLGKAVSVGGIGGMVTPVQKRVNVKLLPCNRELPALSVTAGVMKHITAATPSSAISVDRTKLAKYQLADCHFDKPGKVDLLLGAEMYSQIMVPEAPVRMDELLLQQTVFGWILTGRLYRAPSSDFSGGASLLCQTESIVDLDSTLRRFWELEGVESGMKAWTLEQKKCEKHFVDTHRRLPDGRYEVCLPFREEASVIGNSRDRARRLYERLERQWSRKPEKAAAQRQGMDEYFELAHAEYVPPESKGKPDSECYYLPYHVVEKLSSTTTKYRNVFNASAKTTSGVSLNDRLMVGPTIQRSIFDILAQFQCYRVVLSADIAMMYRMIKVAEKDRDFLRFFYRREGQDSYDEYRMNTVTFGVASSAHHAQRCLQQLAVDAEKTFPLASHALSHDFYMDDLLSGADTVHEALEIQGQLIDCTDSAGFHLRKWISNTSEIVESVPSEDRATLVSFGLDRDDVEGAKTLGLFWNPIADTISFTATPMDEDIVWTKRSILSETARIFDPLGHLSAVTLVAKLLFKELWQLGLDWDDPVPDDIRKRWIVWRKDLLAFNEFDIDRCIVPKEEISEEDEYQIHGFCDASEKGYSAVVYVRTKLETGNIKVGQIAAKSKVAPTKKTTLPRLELCGAFLLAKLVDSLTQSLRIIPSSIFLWSDSMIALDWIHGDPNRWKTFVGNRVSQIQDLVPVSAWRHCTTDKNPADCGSRGLLPSELISHELWWHGPDFLTSADSWPNHREATSSEQSQLILEEVKSEVVASLPVRADKPEDLFARFGTWTKLIRITAWCRRWLSRRTSGGEPKKGSLTVAELNDARLLWIKRAQKDTYSAEIETLTRGEQLPRNDSLLPLTPWVDDQGILRVGGRLANSNLPRDAKFQIILPRSHRLTDMLLLETHLYNLHAPPRMLLGLIRQKYWLVNGYEKVRTVCSRCVKCRRLKAATMVQLMGQLPAARVNPTFRAFVRVGVDYGGPYVLKTCIGRNRKTFKVWISLFICLVTKACHLEVVTSLTEDCFLAAFRRMLARRGMVSDMYSDNAGTFRGADRELREFLENEPVQKKFEGELSKVGVQWHFAPPKGSHFGGIYEAAIKSMKTLLYRGMTGTTLTLEEFNTLICQIEALLNSRPITPLSSDPTDLDFLTPGHFLIGGPITAVVEPDLTDVKMNRLDRWQLVQHMFQKIWKRYSAEYVHHLQQKSKWLVDKKQVMLDDLVLLVDENAHPLNWRMGRIVECYPGKDNIVRVVDVKTRTGIFRRPIAKLTRLLSADEV